MLKHHLNENNGNALGIKPGDLKLKRIDEISSVHARTYRKPFKFGPFFPF